MNKKALSALWLGIFLVFFWPMWLKGYGFYYGDYKQQFYPWAKEFYGYARHFSLPLWTSKIGCGFPLLAEGQIGALYPLNWLLCWLLPFEWAYHAMFVSLFALSAWFFVRYGRESGIEALPASLGAVSFLFGSAYAGLFFGLAALRTAVFFVPMLYFGGKLAESRSWKDACLLAASTALAFLGGYPQLAIYMVAACGLWQIFFTKKLGFKFLCALALGGGLAACQIAPTLELAAESGRRASELHFALQRSMNPAALFNLAWPGFGFFTGQDFYGGFLPLCFAIFAVVSMRRDKRAIFFALLGFLAVFLALGRLNPLYVGFLKLTHLYFLRTPTKFLFFAFFALAWLAAAGLSRALTSQEEWKRFAKTVCVTSAVSIALFTAAHFAARLGKDFILQWAEQYVRNEVFGRAGHPYSIEEYLSRLPQSLTYVIQKTSFRDPYFLTSLGVQLLSIALVLALRASTMSRKTFVSMAVVIFTVLDLFLYTRISSGFLGNCVSREVVAADPAVEFLLEQEGRFRVYEMATHERGVSRWPANSNMIFGYSSLGLYSPLAVDRYREYLRPVGGVDNASGAYLATKESVAESVALLERLNVRYILTKENMDGVSSVRRVNAEDDKSEDRIYELKPKSRAFLVPHAELEIAKLDDGSAVFRSNATAESILFWSELTYPGWEATIDGKKTAISAAEGVFQSVAVPAGRHEIKFDFKPLSFRIGCLISAASFLVLLFLWRVRA